MANNFKERVDMAIGKASVIVAENTAKVTAFVGEQKDKAVEFIDSKQKLYKAKTGLDEATKKLDNLFNELGRVSYYKQSTVPDRTSADIRNDIKATLAEVEELQKVYDSLKPVNDDEDVDEDVDEE